MDYSDQKQPGRIYLKTPRLLLRNFIPEDKNFLIQLWTDPEVTHYMGGPRTVEKMNQAAAEYTADPFECEYDLWILEETATRQTVGHCGLLEKIVDGKPEIELTYVIDKDHWGQGYATEIAKTLVRYAFDEKKLTSIIALIKPENKGSEKVALNAGLILDKEVLRPENTRMLLYRRCTDRI